MFEFRLPDVGEGVHEGEIVRWLVEPGANVAADQDIVEVMTDKATVMLSSPVAGTVKDLRAKAGDVVRVGDVIVVIDDGAAPDPAGTRGAAAPAKEPKPPSSRAPIQPLHAPSATARPAPATAPAPTPFHVRAPPSVRRQARRRGVDLSTMTGRVTRERADGPERAPAPRPGRLGEFDRARFDDAARSIRQGARFAYAQEAIVPDAPPERVWAAALEALTRAARLHPEVNATVDADTGELLIHGDVNLLVRTPRGSIVIAAADRLGRAELEARLRSDRSDVAEATLGVHLVDLPAVSLTPVLPALKTMVLALGTPRLVATLDGPRRVLTLSAAFDHRYVDGEPAARVVDAIRQTLETWEK